MSSPDHTASDTELDTGTGAGTDTGTGADRLARLCARVGCGRTALATLTADYEDRVMAVGPLSPMKMPPALDLCEMHRDALSPPEGWTLIAHEEQSAHEEQGAHEA